MDSNTLIEIVTNPVTWMILGLLVSKFAPSWVPFLGESKKIADELAELHKKSKTLNPVIISNAHNLKLKKAAEFLEKKF